MILAPVPYVSGLQMLKLEKFGMHMCHEVEMFLTRCSIDERCYKWELEIRLIEVIYFEHASSSIAVI